MAVSVYTGTADLVNNSPTITVSGFTLSPLGIFHGAQVAIDGEAYFLDSVTNTTTAELTRPYTGPTASGLPLEINTISDEMTTIVSLNIRTADLIEDLLEFDPLGNLASISPLTGSGVIMQGATGAHSLVPKADLISGADYDVQVDTLPDRAAYDTRPANYRVLVSDTGDERSAIYSKNTNTTADWSAPAYVTGPSITLTVTEVDEVPYGTPPDVTLTPIAGGYDMTFEIPRGMIIVPGATTTLAADQPAAVTFVPVLGGYRLDIAIPRGATGDIDGVTPFWQGRITVDTTAAAARTGLGAARAATAGSAPNDTDFNALTQEGWASNLARSIPDGINPGAAPELSTYFFVHNIVYSPIGSLIQRAFPYSATGSVYRRFLFSGNWSPWVTEWSDLNMPLVTKPEAEAGLVTDPRAWSPERVADAIAALAAGGGGGSVDQLFTDDLTAVFNASQKTQARTNIAAYGRSNILGSVSQVAGVPAGAIIERGSNANGEYVKFADGTQICSGRKSSSIAVDVASGAAPGGFRSAAQSFTFPAAFITAPYFSPIPEGISGGSLGAGFISHEPTTTTTGSAYLAAAQNTAVVGLAFIAIGRWF